MSNQNQGKRLTPQHFANGRSFDPELFDQWLEVSRKCAVKGSIHYLVTFVVCLLISLLFSKAMGGFSGNILAVAAIIAAIPLGAYFMKKAHADAAALDAQLGITREDVAAARKRLKNGAVAWTEDAPASSRQ